jgi:hypothetical protein
MRRLVYVIALTTVAPLALAQARPTAAAATQPTTRPSGATTQPLAPGQLLDSLLKPPSSAGQPLQPIQEGPVLDAKTGNAAVAPGAPQLTLRREGTYIVDRTARLTRGGADGQQSELTFDADGQAMKDPPMIILPNLKLMQMETAVTEGAKDMRFKVTGLVTEYKGRNYILLEKVVVVPDVVQQF